MGTGRRVGAAALLAAAWLVTGCVVYDYKVPLGPTLPAGLPAIGGETTVRVEPFADARGMQILGRARNGYLWPMCAFRPATPTEVSDMATSRTATILKRSGFRVVEGPGAGGGLTVRGSVQRAYCDAGWFFQTSTELEVEVWRGDELVATRTYRGYAWPLMITPASVPNAFNSSFRALFARAARDLPQVVAETAK